MTRDELLVLARKCGFDITVNDGVPEDIVFIDWEHPEQTHVITSQALLFAKAVSAAEREAIIKLCDQSRDTAELAKCACDETGAAFYDHAALDAVAAVVEEIAVSVRARGQQ